MAVATIRECLTCGYIQTVPIQGTVDHCPMCGQLFRGCGYRDHYREWEED